MKKVLYIILSIIVMLIEVYGLINSLPFSEWIILDIIICLILFFKTYLFNRIIGEQSFINLDFLLFFLIIFAFFFKFKYNLWIVVDILVILGQPISIILLFIIDKDNKKGFHR